MPSPIIHLSLRIERRASRCALCQGTGAVFALFESMREGMDRCHGPSICPDCIIRHGHHGAVLKALEREEADMLEVDREEVAAGLAEPGQVERTYAEYRQLQSLVTGGQFTAPPPIPAEHFGAVEAG